MKALDATHLKYSAQRKKKQKKNTSRSKLVGMILKRSRKFIFSIRGLVGSFSGYDTLALLI